MGKYKTRECPCDDFQSDIDSYGDWLYCPWCGKPTIEVEKDD
jgi:hypothetical protein